MNNFFFLYYKCTTGLLIIFLYLLTPVCVMCSLGTMVSLKYEVDQSYWMIDNNENLTANQKAKERNELDTKGRKLQTQANSYTIVAVVTFIIATGH